MEFYDVIRDRYSCKRFDGTRPSKEELEQILEAGRLAPTSKNLQEQHIYVLESNEALDTFDKVSPCRYGAPLVLVVAFDSTNTYVYPGGKRNSGVEDASIVATHMLLAVRNVGVDSCWVNRLDPDVLASELGLPENEVVLMALDLGHAAEGTTALPNHSKRKPLAETVTYL